MGKNYIKLEYRDYNEKICYYNYCCICIAVQMFRTERNIVVDNAIMFIISYINFVHLGQKEMLLKLPPVELLHL